MSLSLLFLIWMSVMVVVVNSESIDISEMSLADTAHQVLLPAVSTIEAGFNSGQTSLSATTETTALSIIHVIATADVASALSSVAAAYRTVNSAFSLQVTTADTGALAKNKFLTTGAYDLAITPSAPEPADFKTMPSLQFFPFVAIGIVSAYNLPLSFTNGFDLLLTGLILCQIHRGNISSWNDPAIKALNPSFNWNQITSSRLIEVITVTVGTTPHLAFTSYCNKIDPSFAAIISPSTMPNYQATFLTPVDSLARAGDRVEATRWSITITNVPRALAVPLPFVNFITSSGDQLTGDSDSVGLGVINLSSLDKKFIGDAIDLTNPDNPQAWPISLFQYVYIDTENTRTSCATKRTLLQFLLWSYSNPIPQAIFTESNIVPLPSILIERFNLLEYLRTAITCDNAALVAANAATLFVSADPAIESLIRIFSHFYSDVDTAYTFKTRRLTESLSLERLRLNEAAFALIRPNLLSEDDINVIQTHGFVSVPTLMVGIVPIFTLPDIIVSLSGNTTTIDALGLPPLYPLVLDLETMARMFTGNVASWLDPGLVAINPQLAPWFNVTQANTTLSVVAGALAQSDISIGARVIFGGIAASKVAREHRYRLIFGSSDDDPTAAWRKSENPFGLLLDVTYIDGTPPTNIQILDYESLLSIRCSEIPGSVSYRVIGSEGIGISDPKVEFRMVQTPDSMTQPEVVEAYVTNINNCALKHTDAAIAMGESSGGFSTVGSSSLLSLDLQRHWVDPIQPPQGCWPLSVLVSTITPMQYQSNKSSGSVSTDTSSIDTTADACVLAQHGLEFSNYIQSTDSLSLPAEQLGISRLASIQVISDLSQSVLYATTCDSLPVLVTVPSYFSISPGITQFGIAIGALGLITITISLVLVIVFRHRIIIRSSSVPFLVLILCGLGLLFISSITWSIGPSPTAASCSVFVWFSQIGFMMVYIPLFAKTYRVWRIFSGSHLKVVKISNKRLLGMSVMAIVIDLLILSIWQGVSPIQPIQYARQLNDHWDYYTHCSVDSKGLPFVIIEAVYKAGILLFGALMAFSTRNVKATFNESTQIAWSIYNTLLAAIIVAIMITFLNAIQSTLIIMVQILLLWMPICTWALLFIPKFQLLLGKTENEVIEASRSELLPQEKSNGFSFASVAFMSQNQLRSYYDALKSQVTKVQQRLGVTLTKFEATPGMVNLEGGSLLSNGKNLSGNNSRNNSKNSLIGEPPTSTNKNNSTGGGNAHIGQVNSFATTKLPPTSSMSKGGKPLERSVTPTSSTTPISTLTSTGMYSSTTMKVNKESSSVPTIRAGNYMINQLAEHTVLAPTGSNSIIGGNDSPRAPSPTVSSIASRHTPGQRYHSVMKGRTGGGPGPSQHHRSIDQSSALLSNQIDGVEMPITTPSPESATTICIPGAIQAPAPFAPSHPSSNDPLNPGLISPSGRISSEFPDTDLSRLGAQTPQSTQQQPLIPPLTHSESLSRTQSEPGDRDSVAHSQP